MTCSKAKAATARVAVFSFAGWLVENLYEPPRYSKVFGGAKVPLLPVYGAAGAAIEPLMRQMPGLHLLARAVVYGAAFTGIEWAACKLDRANGNESWAYGPDRSCVDLPHAMAWAALGLVAEALIEVSEPLSCYKRR